jgi:hypothetical protein
MSDFDAELSRQQTEWRVGNIDDTRHGWQNGVQRPWILDKSVWRLGLWAGIRETLPAYIDGVIERHQGSHNLKSSWILCANLYFPFRSKSQDLLAGFLRERVDPSIVSVEDVSLEHEEEKPLDPKSLLGEPATGKRGANQTSPDVAFTVKLADGRAGLLLTESKLSEHSFYSCSGRKADVGNPDSSRCMDWPAVLSDTASHCWQMKWEEPGRPNRRYWEHLAPSDEARRQLNRCPAATAGYQLFRQQALAEAIAKHSHYGLVASCVAYDGRNEDLISCLRTTGIDDFSKGWATLFKGQARFVAWTHQDWVSYIRVHGGAAWQDWLDYLHSRYGY